MNKCALCGLDENQVKLIFCSICEKFFCEPCRRNYPLRVKEMMKEKVGTWKEKIFRR